MGPGAVRAGGRPLPGCNGLAEAAVAVGGVRAPPPRDPGEAGSESVLHSCFVRVPVGVGMQQWGGPGCRWGKTRRGSVGSAGRGRGGTQRLVLGRGVVVGWQLEQCELVT